MYSLIDNAFYWHCKPGTKHEIAKFKSQIKNIRKDQIKANWAKENNMDLLIFWESDINADENFVTKSILSYIESKKKDYK